jgi:pimeloyl-ACP methyl ester carboxylesterase
LVITGGLDMFCPPKASGIIHDGIPGSILRILPGAGHCAHWEQADTINDIALDFLSGNGTG